MSAHQANDEFMTAQLLAAVQLLAAQQLLPYREQLLNRETSWLRHGGGAGQIDHLLLIGATAGEMQHARPTYLEHIHHLRTEHHLPINEGGTCSFGVN